MRKIVLIFALVGILFPAFKMSGNSSEEDLKATQKWLKKQGIKMSLYDLKYPDSQLDWWGERDEIDTSIWNPRDIPKVF